MESSCKCKHVRAQPHSRRSGRGILGRHWECEHEGCEFNDGVWLYDSIVGACYLECEDCGEMIDSIFMMEHMEECSGEK